VLESDIGTSFFGLVYREYPLGPMETPIGLSERHARFHLQCPGGRYWTLALVPVGHLTGHAGSLARETCAVASHAAPNTYKSYWLRSTSLPVILLQYLPTTGSFAIASDFMNAGEISQ